MAAIPAAASAAYQAAANMGVNATPTKGIVPADIGSGMGAGSFSDFLGDAMKSSIGTMKQGEQMAVKQVAGKADIVDVVNAVNSAEITLDTVVAVRDKVVQAYQSIMNMPI